MINTSDIAKEDQEVQELNKDVLQICCYILWMKFSNRGGSIHIKKKLPIYTTLLVQIWIEAQI